MSHRPDPRLLDGCAHHARRHGTQLRLRAARLGAGADSVAWAGPAARAFRLDAHAAVGRLQAAAGDLDDAADRLERHAAALRAGHPR